MKNADRKRSLLFAGALLVLVGLLSGVAIPATTTARLGLSAHLAGVQGGMLVMIVGLAWNHLHLSPRLAATAFGTTIFSNYALYAALQLAAVWGTSRSTPIAGEGASGSSMQESAVDLLLYSGSAAAIVALTLVVWGLVPSRDEQPSTNED